jgi:hypothetical protein
MRRLGLSWSVRLSAATREKVPDIIDRGATVRFAKVSVRHDGRALATDVFKALETLSR